MIVRHSDPRTEKLEKDASFSGGHSQPIVSAFRKRMQFIRQAVDERDFAQMRSFRFEKLKGNRSHQWSMRLNDQWRLILEIEQQKPKNVIVIVGIEDYH